MYFEETHGPLLFSRVTRSRRNSAAVLDEISKSKCDCETILCSKAKNKFENLFWNLKNVHSDENDRALTIQCNDLATNGDRTTKLAQTEHAHTGRINFLD